MDQADRPIQSALQGMLHHYQAEGHSDIQSLEDVIGLYGCLRDEQHIGDLLSDWQNVQQMGKS